MLIISELARSDIKEIWSYIAENDVDVANRVAKELSDKFDLLEANPHLGRKRNEFVVDLRSFPYKKYIIFYFEIEDGVEIFRVLHSSRNIENLFDEIIDSIN